MPAREFDLVPASKRPFGKMGIVTQRRQPPNVGRPRYVPPRFMPKPEPVLRNWSEIQQLKQARWQLQMGAKIKQAENFALGRKDEAGGDALDQHLVAIQQEHLGRLYNIERNQRMPIVQRLVNPPPPPPVFKDPLELFMDHVNHQHQLAMAQQPQPRATKPAFARPAPAFRNEPGMPTKMGLFYAR